MEFEVLGDERALNIPKGRGYLGGRGNTQKSLSAAVPCRAVPCRAVPFKVITDLHSPFLNEKEIFTKIVIKRLDKGEPPA